MMTRKMANLIIGCFLGFFMPAGLYAEESYKVKPVIAIIIDDMGNNLGLGMEAINLSGPLTYSFLPFTPHAVVLAEIAYARNKEVMLHVPMQPLGNQDLGTGGLSWDMSEAQVVESFTDQLQVVPHIRGVNNHMGSFLTQDYIFMGWIMDVIKHQDKKLFFVDSRTTSFSIAKKTAEKYGVPAVKRDVFFDHIEDESHIREQFVRLISIAKKRGYAVGIGHPKEKTHKVLKEMLAGLQCYGVELLSVSKLIKKKAEVVWARNGPDPNQENEVLENSIIKCAGLSNPLETAL